jgi:hypothetical protein
MRLDKDLVRTILIAIEASDTDPLSGVDVRIPDRTEQEISYHIQLLDEARFITAEDLSTLGGYEWRAKRLTYNGHEFLDDIRDSRVWTETKKIAEDIGAGSVHMLFEIAKAYLTQQIRGYGLHLG